MTSGQDVSECLDTLGLVKSYFFKFFEEKKLKKIMKKKCLGAPDAPEGKETSLFVGFLPSPDKTLSQKFFRVIFSFLIVELCM
jgi:hypothetical protein